MTQIASLRRSDEDAAIRRRVGCIATVALPGARRHSNNSGTPRQICAGPRSHRHGSGPFAAEFKVSITAPSRESWDATGCACTEPSTLRSALKAALKARAPTVIDCSDVAGRHYVIAASASPWGNKGRAAE